MKFIKVPEEFAKVINDYGFGDTKLLDKAVATREASGWYGILFHDEGEFFAVDFCLNGEGCWEVQNDWVGPFEDILTFKSESLTHSFI